MIAYHDSVICRQYAGFIEGPKPAIARKLNSEVLFEADPELLLVCEPVPV